MSVFYSCLNAQTHSLSISGGINRTNVTGDFSEEWNSNTGFTGAFDYEYRFANGLLVEIGIRYHQTGFNDDMHFVFPDFETVSINANYQYEHIGFPVKFGYGNFIGNKLSWFAKIGFYPAYLTKGQLKTSLIGGTLSDPGISIGTTDFKNNASKFNLAGLAEAGVGYRIFNKWTPFFSMSYQHSLTVLGKDNFKGANVRHYGLIFSLGIKYDL